MVLHAGIASISPRSVLQNANGFHTYSLTICHTNSSIFVSPLKFRLIRQAARKNAPYSRSGVASRAPRATATGNENRKTFGKESNGVLDPAEASLGHDYYKILGVSVNSPPAAIRKAYWQLQKKYHPDVAGEEGHATALLLNLAYSTLMDDHRRSAYVDQWKAAAAAGYSGFTGQPLSQWRGAESGEGVFVDEATCVGCQECAHVAPNTFHFDSTVAKARVKVQWGDTEATIRSAVESCPVNCIHAVPRGDLPALEFLMQPREKASRGVLGGGWGKVERGTVFQAAQTFRKRLEKQQGEAARRERSSEESFDQRAARMAADRLTWPAPLQWLWSMAQVVSFVRDWSSMWASSSELPLPMPFRCDPITDGVQLTVVTISSGMISSIGSLVIQIVAGPTEDKEEGEEGEGGVGEGEAEVVFELRVRRVGGATPGPLPGEGRIMKELKKALAARGSASGYEAYHIPRRGGSV